MKKESIFERLGTKVVKVFAKKILPE